MFRNKASTNRKQLLKRNFIFLKNYQALINSTKTDIIRSNSYILVQ